MEPIIANKTFWRYTSEGPRSMRVRAGGATDRTRFDL
jgi:hypothetical protein